MVGMEIKELRLDRGLTQEQLASRAAMSERALRAIECEGAEPQPRTRFMLALALGVEPSDLDDERSPAEASIAKSSPGMAPRHDRS